MNIQQTPIHLVRMSCSQQALAGGYRAGAIAPLLATRGFIRPAAKLQSRPCQTAVLETKPPVERVTGRSAFSDPSSNGSGRSIDEL
jgi:hypothetical protein